MDDLVGFHVDKWDYITFLALIVIAGGFIVFLIFVMGLPGRIAIARRHPEAEAVNLMGYLGFLAVVPWVQAFVWAFKPTDVVDIRYFPRDVKRHTDESIARIGGKAPEESVSKTAELQGQEIKP
jgi:Protein of unknown function (DUF3302)